MATYRWILTGDVPAKKNNPIITRDRRRLPSARYMEWERRAVSWIRGNGCPERALERAEIMIDVYHGDLRRRDGDNALTSIQDMLMKAGVIRDDSWQAIGTPTMTHHVGPFSRVEIEVKEVPPMDWAAKLKEAKKEAEYGY